MRILLPISLHSSRDEALSLAIDTARSLRGEIRGLFVLDSEGIHRSESGAPPGAIYLAHKAEEIMTGREASEGAAALGTVSAVCRDAGVLFSGGAVAGNLRREMEKTAAACDLLVAGIGSQFAHGQVDAPGETVLSLMKGRVIPLLLAEARYHLFLYM